MTTDANGEKGPATLSEAARAIDLLAGALITCKPFLDVPFPDRPDVTPWQVTCKRRLREAGVIRDRMRKGGIANTMTDAEFTAEDQQNEHARIAETLEEWSYGHGLGLSLTADEQDALREAAYVLSREATNG